MALLGAGVLAALMLSQGEANRQRDRALALQTHSYQVMILARSLAGTVARSEASLGRYVISGDHQLGQMYYEQWQAAGQQLDRLDQITEPVGPQQRRIDALRQAYRTRGDELALIALSTAYRKNNQALARYYQASKAPSLARINAELDAIIAGERSVLDERTTVAMGSVARSSSAAHVFSVFGVLIAIGAVILGWLTIKAQAERALARDDAERARERTRELQEAVTAATDELRAQESKLRQAQKMEAVGQLTGGIAHDFNNMLAVVLGGLELARRHAARDGHPSLRHIDSAAEGAGRAAALTRRLLAFSREDVLKPQPLDAATLIAGMSDLLDRTLGDGITVEVRAANRGWAVLADRVALENAVLNLAVNARDAMDGRGRLLIETDAVLLKAGEIGACGAGEHVTLAVTDTGCGMTSEVIDRIFEPFFTTKPVGKGTGLGLSQLFATVRAMDGEIAIRSTPGSGTTVTLYLPRHAGTVLPVSTPEPAPAAESAPDALRVLVVEDDPRVLAATVGALEELGHCPLACNDPLVAAATIDASGAIDLLISDVLMPGQTGPEMVASLMPRYPKLPVLFVTGFAGEAGAEDFADRHVLRKPFTLNALEQAIADTMATRPVTIERRAAA
jgi:signal transduction histidine kinase/CheY-like chemotaxis protein